MTGTVTVTGKKQKNIPEAVTAGLDTVGIRFPANKTAQDFIKSAGTPIAAPSANISGKPSPTRAADVIADMNGRIEAVINGGDCEVGVESTIVDASGDVPVLLRPGRISLYMPLEVVPATQID